MSCKNFVDSTGISTSSTISTNSASLIKSASLTANTISTAGETLTSFTAPSGIAYSTVTVDQGSQFQALSICGSDAIFGLTGTAVCLGSGSTTLVPTDTLLQSNTGRAKGTSQVGQIQEVTTYASNALPAGYHDIPILAQDDDGYVNRGNVNYGTRPASDCGLSGSLTTRIGDCNLSWDGNTQANLGQGLWKLVTRSGLSHEVWQDQRTGLVWSSNFAGTSNWCQASGNAEAADASNYCNNVTYQPYYISNNIGLSKCAETGTYPANAAEAVGSTLGNTWSGTYLAQKGGMGLQSTPAVRWRLPTKSDYAQAEVDGIRFVMPDMGATGGSFEWTATIVSNARNSAYFFYIDMAELGTSSRFNTMAVRCVGH
jgi:hypothetical protein